MGEFDPYRDTHPALPEISGAMMLAASVITLLALAGGVICVALLIRTLGRAIWGP
jgi:hypothetical protein